MPDDIRATDPAIFRQAYKLREQKKYAEALELFLQLLSNPHSFLTNKQWRHSYSHALTCTAKLKDWDQTDALARKAIEDFAEHGDAYCRLGEAMVRRHRYQEAEAALLKAIEYSPMDKEAPLLLELARAQAGWSARPKVAPWPSRPAAFENPRSLIERYVLRHPKGAPIIEADSVFMTLGSCFAQNLAERLRENGRSVFAEEIGEDINSTHANRYLLDWIENGVTGAATASIQEAYGPLVRERMRSRIAQSDVFVITLGVAACFFRKSDGEFAFIISKTSTARDHLYANHVMRMTDVAENVANIQAMMDTITRLASRKPKFVLTVSPVPIGGTTERESAIVADCISKSTMRLAAEQLRADPGRHKVVYWPSFEIVRWLGPHFGPGQTQVYGADDGNTRHVSKWLVALIIDMFLDHHTAEEPSVQAQT